MTVHAFPQPRAAWQDAIDPLTVMCDSFAVSVFSEPLPTTLEEAAQALQAVRNARQRLQDAERKIEGQVASLMTRKETVIDGFGKLTRHGGVTRKNWEHTRLAQVLTSPERIQAERKVDERTGEIEPEAETATRILLEAAGVGYWRTTALKARGLDISEFCDEEEGRHTVAIKLEEPSS